LLFVFVFMFVLFAVLCYLCLYVALFLILTTWLLAHHVNEQEVNWTELSSVITYVARMRGDRSLKERGVSGK